MAHKELPNTTPYDVVQLDFRRNGSLQVPLLRHLDELAEQHREEFNDMLGELSKGKERDIDWWVTQPLVRNTHTSPLFGQCLKVALVRRLLDDGRRLEVIVDSPELAHVFRQASGKSLKVLLRRPFRLRLQGLSRTLWNIRSSIFHAFGSAVAARYTKRLARPLPSEPLTILDVFVFPNTFHNGEFNDRYYPGLVEFLTEHEKRATYYVPIFDRIRNYLEVFRWIRTNKVNFILRQDYLGISDYVFAFGHWVRTLRYNFDGATFAGFDVAPLLMADLSRGRFCNSVVNALLYYRFWLSLKRAGVRVRVVIEWFEGQDIDRGSAAALNWHWPEVQLTGYRGIIASPLYLCSRPSAAETVAGVVPRRIALFGKGYEAEMLSANPNQELSQAPALRYQQLWTLKAEKTPNIANILVSLPITLEASVRILSILSAMTDIDLGRPVKWWVKPHPAVDMEQITNAMGSDMSSDFEVIAGDFYYWLERANLVISTVSGTLLEALAIGIPCICIAMGNTFTHNSIPPSIDRRWWRICYDIEDVSISIHELIQTAPEIVEGGEVLASYFNPVTREGCRNFLLLADTDGGHAGVTP